MAQKKFSHFLSDTVSDLVIDVKKIDNNKIV